MSKLLLAMWPCLPIGYPRMWFTCIFQFSKTHVDWLGKSPQTWYNQDLYSLLQMIWFCSHHWMMTYSLHWSCMLLSVKWVGLKWRNSNYFGVFFTRPGCTDASITGRCMRVTDRLRQSAVLWMLLWWRSSCEWWTWASCKPYLRSFLEIWCGARLFRSGFKIVFLVEMGCTWLHFLKNHFLGV